MQAKILWVGKSSVFVAAGGKEIGLPIGDWHTKTRLPKVGQWVEIVWSVERDRWVLQ